MDKVSFWTLIFSSAIQVLPNTDNQGPELQCLLKVKED